MSGLSISEGRQLRLRFPLKTTPRLFNISLSLPKLLVKSRNKDKQILDCYFPAFSWLNDMQVWIRVRVCARIHFSWSIYFARMSAYSRVVQDLGSGRFSEGARGWMVVPEWDKDETSSWPPYCKERDQEIGKYCLQGLEVGDSRTESTLCCTIRARAIWRIKSGGQAHSRSPILKGKTNIGPLDSTRVVDFHLD